MADIPERRLAGRPAAEAAAAPFCSLSPPLLSSEELERGAGGSPPSTTGSLPQASASQDLVRGSTALSSASVALAGRAARRRSRGVGGGESVFDAEAAAASVADAVVLSIFFPPPSLLACRCCPCWHSARPSSRPRPRALDEQSSGHATRRLFNY